MPAPQPIFSMPLPQDPSLALAADGQPAALEEPYSSLPPPPDPSTHVHLVSLTAKRRGRGSKPRRLIAGMTAAAWAAQKRVRNAQGRFLGLGDVPFKRLGRPPGSHRGAHKHTANLHAGDPQQNQEPLMDSIDFFASAPPGSGVPSDFLPDLEEHSILSLGDSEHAGPQSADAENGQAGEPEGRRSGRARKPSRFFEIPDEEFLEIYAAVMSEDEYGGQKRKKGSAKTQSEGGPHKKPRHGGHPDPVPSAASSASASAAFSRRERVQQLVNLRRATANTDTTVDEEREKELEREIYIKQALAAAAKPPTTLPPASQKTTSQPNAKPTSIPVYYDDCPQCREALKLHSQQQKAAQNPAPVVRRPVPTPSSFVVVKPRLPKVILYGEQIQAQERNSFFTRNSTIPLVVAHYIYACTKSKASVSKDGYAYVVSSLSRPAPAPAPVSPGPVYPVPIPTSAHPSYPVTHNVGYGGYVYPNAGPLEPNMYNHHMQIFDPYPPVYSNPTPVKAVGGLPRAPSQYSYTPANFSAFASPSSSFSPAPSRPGPTSAFSQRTPIQQSQQQQQPSRGFAFVQQPQPQVLSNKPSTVAQQNPYVLQKGSAFTAKPLSKALEARRASVTQNQPTTGNNHAAQPSHSAFTATPSHAASSFTQHVSPPSAASTSLSSFSSFPNFSAQHGDGSSNLSSPRSPAGTPTMPSSQLPAYPVTAASFSRPSPLPSITSATGRAFAGVPGSGAVASAGRSISAN